jgi:hypothetical protein
MGSVLSPSGFNAPDIGDTNWSAQDTINWTLLNSTLLKLSALFDVDVTGISDGDILKYNSVSGKWEPKTPTLSPHTTTSTTTTSTTTTT